MGWESARDADRGGAPQESLPETAGACSPSAIICSRRTPRRACSGSLANRFHVFPPRDLHALELCCIFGALARRILLHACPTSAAATRGSRRLSPEPRVPPPEHLRVRRSGPWSGSEQQRCPSGAIARGFLRACGRGRFLTGGNFRLWAACPSCVLLSGAGVAIAAAKNRPAHPHRLGSLSRHQTPRRPHHPAPGGPAAQRQYRRGLDHPADPRSSHHHVPALPKNLRRQPTPLRSAQTQRARATTAR